MTRRRLLGVGTVIVIVFAALVFLWLGRRGDGETLLASGTVEATDADLGFQIPGRIDSVGPQEGRRVQAGSRLASLDLSELEARRAAVEAQVSAARARLRELTSGFRAEEVAQGRAALDAAERKVADAIRDLGRTRRLREGGAVSQQRLDDAETALELARAHRWETAERLRILERGPRLERIDAARAEVTAAEAAVARVEAELRNGVIHAPFSGIVTIRHREPGETVAAGAPVLTVMNPGDRWVRIYIREDAVGRVALGQMATITSDSYPDRRYRGEVSFIASEAEFTPKSVQTAEERVKLVYEVKVRIDGDRALDLKPGLAADVRLLYGTP